MSYIQIEIGGKKRGLKFLQMAITILAQKADFNNYAATANYAMIYGGLMCNCYVKGVEPDFTFEQVCEWVDELKPETIAAVDAVLAETQVYKTLIESDKKDSVSDKKKLKRTTKNAIK